LQALGDALPSEDENKGAMVSISCTARNLILLDITDLTRQS